MLGRLQEPGGADGVGNERGSEGVISGQEVKETSDSEGTLVQPPTSAEKKRKSGQSWFHGGCGGGLPLY